MEQQHQQDSALIPLTKPKDFGKSEYGLQHLFHHTLSSTFSAFWCFCFCLSNLWVEVIVCILFFPGLGVSTIRDDARFEPHVAIRSSLAATATMKSRSLSIYFCACACVCWCLCVNYLVIAFIGKFFMWVFFFSFQYFDDF